MAARVKVHRAAPVAQSAAERPRPAQQRTGQRAALPDHRPAAHQLAQLAALANPVQSSQLRSVSVPGIPNRTGLPAALKAGVEQLSGQSLDHVRVHRNSSKPAQLNAHAYAQGSDIHLAPGQEKHLPHEAWHVVQQAQGRVKPTVQTKGIPLNHDRNLEHEAEVMGQRIASGGSTQPAAAPLRRTSVAGVGGATASPVQRVAIADVTTLKTHINTVLDAGESAAGSSHHLLSGNAANATKLCDLFMPVKQTTDKSRTAALARNANNDYYMERNDQLLARVQRGATELMEAVLYWSRHMATGGQREVTPVSVELSGSDLHDRGLGAAKVGFMIEAHVVTHDDYSRVVYKVTRMIKPEDRSIEQALLGPHGSLAAQLNPHVPTTKQVSTIDTEVHATHGTSSEYVESGLHEAATYVLRKLRMFYSTDDNAVETIGLAFLAGIWDLHGENVILRGGKPVLVDADVALRPAEFNHGPDTQEGLERNGTTARVKRQLAGATETGQSALLQYAIDHPDKVIAMIKGAVGDLTVRIIPLFTKDLVFGQQNYVSLRAEAATLRKKPHELEHKSMGSEGKRRESASLPVEGAGLGLMASDPDPAEVADRKAWESCLQISDGIRRGGAHFEGKGLTGEIGADRANIWNGEQVANAIRADYESGQLPFITYQPSTGLAFFHGHQIWKGTDIAESMTALEAKLQTARTNAKKGKLKKT